MIKCVGLKWEVVPSFVAYMQWEEQAFLKTGRSWIIGLRQGVFWRMMHEYCVWERERLNYLQHAYVCVFVTLGVTLVGLVCGLERGDKKRTSYSQYPHLRIGSHGRHLGDGKLHQHTSVSPWSSVKKKNQSPLLWEVQKSQCAASAKFLFRHTCT